MKTKAHLISSALAASIMVWAAGCSRTTRTNPEQAQTTQEGGSTSVKGAAGKSENFGDTRAAKKNTGASPSESPTGSSRDAEPGKAPPVTPQTPAEPAPK
jgi:hypothetical protein